MKTYWWLKPAKLYWNLNRFPLQVWFQNRRMKDKRQKMTWPCGDPVLAAYVLQAAAANGAFPFNGLYPPIGQFNPQFRPPMFPPGLGLPPLPTPQLPSPPSPGPGPTPLRKEFGQPFTRPLLSMLPASPGSPPPSLHCMSLSLPTSPERETSHRFMMPKISPDLATDISQEPKVSWS